MEDEGIARSSTSVRSAYVFTIVFPFSFGHLILNWSGAKKTAHMGRKADESAWSVICDLYVVRRPGCLAFPNPCMTLMGMPRILK